MIMSAPVPTTKPTTTMMVAMRTARMPIMSMSMPTTRTPPLLLPKSPTPIILVPSPSSPRTTATLPDARCTGPTRPGSSASSIPRTTASASPPAWTMPPWSRRHRPRRSRPPARFGRQSLPPRLPMLSTTAASLPRPTTLCPSTSTSTPRDRSIVTATSIPCPRPLWSLDLPPRRHRPVPPLWVRVGGRKRLGLPRPISSPSLPLVSRRWRFPIWTMRRRCAISWASRISSSLGTRI
mmetsp:Transcript_8030/g.22462  ORF Transcript_8030/g.22462 Transcript_8030/m.22462 type:complete len:237 (+) Transcript_8030:1472-2182(+)